MNLLAGCERIQYTEAMARKNQVPPKNFEEALAELQRILAEIESGKISLEESLEKYERGQFLIQHCRGILGQAEKQIEELTNSPAESQKESSEG